VLATLLAGLRPAESLSYLGVTDYELANGGHAVVYIGQKKTEKKRSRHFTVHLRCTANSEKGLGLFLGRHIANLMFDKNDTMHFIVSGTGDLSS
jgi:hypothetical protein